MSLLWMAIPFGHLIGNRYSVFHLEILVITIGFAIAGAVLGYLLKNRWVYAAVYCLTLFLFLDVYIIPSSTTFLVIGAGICFALFMFFRRIESTGIPATSVAALAFSLAAVLNPSTLPPDRPASAPSEQASKTPGVIHIILDEFGSATSIKNGMPAGHPAADFVDQLVARGFFVHEQAYSISPRTIHSISSIFGLTDALGNAAKNPVGAAVSYRVKQNLLAERIQAAGFATKALQTDFLAICSENQSAGCETHTRTADMNVFTEMNLDIAKRLSLAFLSMHHDYILKNSVRRVWLYRLLARQMFGDLQDYKFFSTPAVVVKLLKKLEIEAGKLPTGTVAFHHFLAPHYPFILDQTCGLKPVHEWRYPPRNEARGATDEQIYRAHWDQAACMAQLVLKIADAGQPGDNPIIIIHGDHGNRLMAGTALQNEAEQLSTFLAIRSPGLAAGRSASKVQLNATIREFYDGLLRVR
jgi:hypothetical protein